LPLSISELLRFSLPSSVLPIPFFFSIYLNFLLLLKRRMYARIYLILKFLALADHAVCLILRQPPQDTVYLVENRKIRTLAAVQAYPGPDKNLERQPHILCKSTPRRLSTCVPPHTRPVSRLWVDAVSPPWHGYLGVAVPTTLAFTVRILKRYLCTYRSRKRELTAQRAGSSAILLPLSA
jgi:hypothetical protein